MSNSLALAELALFVRLVEDRRAVERVHDLHELVRVAHLVLVDDVRLRAGDHALQHRLGEQRQARLGAEDLLLELVDAVLEVAQAHAVRAGVHRCRRLRQQAWSALAAAVPKARAPPLALSTRRAWWKPRASSLLRPQRSSPKPSRCRPRAPQAQPRPLQHRPCWPSSLIERIPGLKTMLATSLSANLQLVASVLADVWPVVADPSELDLAIINLVLNARDAMPSGGLITIAAENIAAPHSQLDENLKGEFVCISVIDNGDGIPADVLPKVFDPFFTTKAVGRGTGLGLSQVYGFAHQSGGNRADRERSRQGHAGNDLPTARRCARSRRRPTGKALILTAGRADSYGRG